MATALTGSFGWTGLHPVQLGGPPLINTFDRKLPATVPPQVGMESAARPFIGHIYQNDGVTALGTFTVLNRPTLTPTLANGGFNQILLEVAAFGSGTLYGVPIYGNPLYGGSSISISQGNVVRLSEQGGDGSFVYGGVVEDLPETIGPSGVKHQILVSPFAVELDDTFSQAVYTSTLQTAPVDISQLVRDAVALTRHCSCDQVSCPAWTGIMAGTSGQLDFRNQSVKQVIDTARSIAGPTWYWHVDELGRVWFQPMGSGAIYTIPRAQYEERTKSASIQDRKNKVVAVGGVPSGASLNVTAVADDLSSQATIGIRALNPPLQVPNISDQTSLTSIANNILTVLNRTWQRVNLKVLPTYGRRIHASQPGGAMVRYYEPAISSMQESSAGTGGYSGIFIAQSLSNDGLRQELTAGDIPVTSQNDVQNMVNSLVARVAANSLQVTAAALNLKQTLTGSFQSGTGTVTSTGLSATLWSLNQTEFEAIDPNGIVRAEMGNLAANGVSPAQWGFRASDANGVPIMDSVGLSQVMQQLGRGDNTNGQNFTTTTPTVCTSTPVTFSLVRAVRVLALIAVLGNSATQTGKMDLFLDGSDLATPASNGASALAWYGFNGPTVTSGNFYSATLAAGSHTFDLRGYVNATPATFSCTGATLIVYSLGT